MRRCYGCGQGFKARSAGKKRRKLCATCWTEQPLKAIPVEVGASYGQGITLRWDPERAKDYGQGSHRLPEVPRA